MKLLRFLRMWVVAAARCWLFRQRWAAQVSMPWPVAPEVTGPWEIEDAAALLAYANSVSGQRLLHRLRQWDHNAAWAACNQPQPEGREYATGYAAGARATVALLIVELTQPPRAEGEFADEPSTDEAQLRARHSP